MPVRDLPHLRWLVGRTDFRKLTIIQSRAQQTYRHIPLLQAIEEEITLELDPFLLLLSIFVCVPIWDSRGHIEGANESGQMVLISFNPCISTLVGMFYSLLRIYFSTKIATSLSITSAQHIIHIRTNIMSKQPLRRKRKSTSSYNEDDSSSDSCMNQLFGNLDLSEKSATPKVVAKALLSLLPDDATKHHLSAKKLVS